MVGMFTGAEIDSEGQNVRKESKCSELQPPIGEPGPKETLELNISFVCVRCIH